jgi:Papain-like cysteine protease AvrRpt2
MEPQQQDEWCWAATSNSVSHFYLPTSVWTQCAIASAELTLQCCSSPLPGDCDTSWRLDQALARTQNLQRMVTGPISYAAVAAEISAGRVVGIRVGWSGGGGHFLAIYGVSETPDGQYYLVDDPIYKKSQPSVDALLHAYQGIGTWTHTYYTVVAPMSLTLLPPTPPIAAAIERARPLTAPPAAGGMSAAATPDAEGATLSAMHDVYAMGLDAVTLHRLPTTPVGVRVLEVGPNGEATAMYALESEPTTRVRSMVGKGPLLDGVSQAIQIASQATKSQTDAATLRTLLIPGAHAETLWLHYADATKDQVIPIFAPRGIKLMVPQGMNAFLDALQDVAKRRQSHEPTEGS